MPEGGPLLRSLEFQVRKGNAVLIKGEAGMGKSILLRAIAGLWPFGRGRIELGPGRVLFVPQSAYMPLGTLAETLLYPGSQEGVSFDSLRNALMDVGLGTLTEELEEDRNWPQRLSISEQQRLAFARILATKPAIVFLDHATSSLDIRAELQLYRLLRQASWCLTVISTSQRADLSILHDKCLDLAHFSVASEFQSASCHYKTDRIDDPQSGPFHAVAEPRQYENGGAENRLV